MGQGQGGKVIAIANHLDSAHLPGELLSNSRILLLAALPKDPGGSAPQPGHHARISLRTGRHVVALNTALRTEVDFIWNRFGNTPPIFSPGWKPWPGDN